MSSFGARLRELRKPLSLEEFACQMGVPASTMGNYERNRNQPPFSLISKLCSHFGVLPDWLLFGNGPKFRDRNPKTGDNSSTIAFKSLDQSEMIPIPMVEARISAQTKSNFFI